MTTRLITKIKTIIAGAKQAAYKSSNTILLNMYWQIGKLIVEDEQKGRTKAAYGKSTLKNLANELTTEFGKGFDDSNLRNIRQFYLAFPIRDAPRHELSRTHYRILSRIENQQLRAEYIIHSIDSNWDARTLQRNIQSHYLGRIIKNISETSSADPNQIFKDPNIFGFLGLPTDTNLAACNIETAIINHLQQLIMDLGRGFAFIARQQHIAADTQDFYIDLVFYNYKLKCFVLIDLKKQALTHSDIGQMDMYVRLYNDLKKQDSDNPTIGLILCTEKDNTIVKYSALPENEKLFASKYRLYLPDEEELKKLIEQDRMNWELNRKNAWPASAT